MGYLLGWLHELRSFPCISSSSFCLSFSLPRLCPFSLGKTGLSFITFLSLSSLSLLSLCLIWLWLSIPSFSSSVWVFPFTPLPSTVLCCSEMHSLLQSKQALEHHQKQENKQTKRFFVSLQGFKRQLLWVLGLDSSCSVYFYFLFWLGIAGSVHVQEGSRHISHTDTKTHKNKQNGFD